MPNSLPDGWVHLHQSDSILDESDFGVGWDDGTTRTKLENWIADFAAHEFPAMNEIIVGCLQEIDSEETNLHGPEDSTFPRESPLGARLWKSNG